MKAALSVAIVMAVGALPAHAQNTPSRAEVRAETQIYIESGLADVERTVPVDFDSPAYAKAHSKFRQLRASPYYSTLVERYASEAAQAGSKTQAPKAAPGLQ